MQDQTQLTYQSPLAHSRLLEQRCEQHQKAQTKGGANLITLSAASSTPSLIHQVAVTTNTNPRCSQCGYTHTHASCPAFGQDCFNYHGTGHFNTYVEGLRPTDTLRTHTTDCPETTESGPQGPVATATHEDHLEGAGSPATIPAESLSEVPELARAVC